MNNKKKYQPLLHLRNYINQEIEVVERKINSKSLIKIDKLNSIYEKEIGLSINGFGN